MAGEVRRIGFGLSAYLAGMKRALADWPAVLAPPGANAEAEVYLASVDEGHLSTSDKMQCRSCFLRGWNETVDTIRKQDIKIYAEERYGPHYG